MKELNALRDIAGRIEGAPLDEYNSMEELTKDNNDSNKTNTNNIQTIEDNNDKSLDSKEDNEILEDNETSEDNEVDTSEGFDIDSLDDETLFTIGQ